jgi:hypothetical protein
MPKSLDELISGEYRRAGEEALRFLGSQPRAASEMMRTQMQRALDIINAQSGIPWARSEFRGGPWVQGFTGVVPLSTYPWGQSMDRYTVPEAMLGQNWWER